MGHSKSSKLRIHRANRSVEALDLRKAGLTFREIGERMGFTEQRAHRLVTQELGRLNAKRSEAAAEVLRLELERLDALLAAVWKRAAKGNVGAIDRCLAIMARRAKLLGIDAPDRSEVSTQSVTLELSQDDRDAAIAAVLARVGRGDHRPALDEAEPARLALESSGIDDALGWDDPGPLADDVAPLRRC